MAATNGRVGMQRPDGIVPGYSPARSRACGRWGSVLLGMCVMAGCRTPSRGLIEPAPTARMIEAGCAMCIYNMEGVADCVLAVKIDGRAYLVTGSDIDDHGDAHAADGLCNAARKARAVGAISDGRYVATKIELQR